MENLVKTEKIEGKTSRSRQGRQLLDTFKKVMGCLWDRNGRHYRIYVTKLKVTFCRYRAARKGLIGTATVEFKTL